MTDLLRSLLEALALFVCLSVILLSLLSLARKKLERVRPRVPWIAFRAPVSMLLIFVSLSVALQLLPKEYRSHPIAVYVPKFALMISLFWLLDRIFSRLFTQPEFFGRAPGGTKSFVIRFLRIAAGLVAILVALDTVGVSITPLLASLGIGSLAIALALQDTLSNFFSGVYLLVDRPLRLGDFIKGPDNIEGIVQRIGWRSTRILHPQNHMIIAPNSKLSSATLQNFDLPDPRSWVAIEATVSYVSDLELVENVARQALMTVASQHVDSLTQAEPVILFQGFKDNGVVLQLAIEAKNRRDKAILTHDLVRELHSGFTLNRIAFVNMTLPSAGSTKAELHPS